MLVLSDEERKLLDITLVNAISGCNRSAAKAGMNLVKEAYAKQAFVLTDIRSKLARYGNEQGKGKS